MYIPPPAHWNVPCPLGLASSQAPSYRSPSAQMTVPQPCISPPLHVPMLWRPCFREPAKHCIVPWIGSRYNFTHTELITETYFEYYCATYDTILVLQHGKAQLSGR